MLGERAQKARRRPALLIGLGGQRGPDLLGGGQPQLGKQQLDTRGIDWVGRRSGSGSLPASSSASMISASSASQARSWASASNPTTVRHARFSPGRQQRLETTSAQARRQLWPSGRRQPVTGRGPRRGCEGLCVAASLGSFPPIMPNLRTKFLTVLTQPGPPIKRGRAQRAGRHGHRLLHEPPPTSGIHPFPQQDNREPPAGPEVHLIVITPHTSTPKPRGTE